MAANLPQELVIWNGLTPMQRFAVMEKIPYDKSMPRRFKKIMIYIRSNLAEFT